MENHASLELADILGGFPFNADEEGFLTLHMPRWGGNDEIPFIAIEDDYGDFVHGVFLDPVAYNGRLIQAVSETAKPEKLVDEFQKSTMSQFRSFDSSNSSRHRKEGTLRPRGGLEVGRDVREP